MYETSGLPLYAHVPLTSVSIQPCPRQARLQLSSLVHSREIPRRGPNSLHREPGRLYSVIPSLLSAVTCSWQGKQSLGVLKNNLLKLPGTAEVSFPDLPAVTTCPVGTDAKFEFGIVEPDSSVAPPVSATTDLFRVLRAQAADESSVVGALEAGLAGKAVPVKERAYESKNVADFAAGMRVVRREPDWSWEDQVSREALHRYLMMS